MEKHGAGVSVARSASGTLHSVPGVVLSVAAVVPLLMDQQYFG